MKYLIFITFVLVSGCTSNVVDDGIPPNASVIPGPGETLDADFFRTSETGQAIKAYLSCEDFDCFQALDSIVASGPEAVTPLIIILEQDLPPGVPQLAGNIKNQRLILALGELRDERAADSLIPFLEDPDPLIRAETATALGHVDEEKALEVLPPMLKDSDQLVREKTALALGEIGSPGALPALRAAAQAESKEHVRQVMEESISAIQQD